MLILLKSLLSRDYNDSCLMIIYNFFNNSVALKINL